MSTTAKVAPRAVKKPTARAETVDVFSLPSNVEFPEVFREVAEKTAQQAKDSYEKMRTATEEATDVIEDQIATARTGLLSFNAKALEAAKANVDAGFNFATKLFGVKSFAEVIELQTAFARSQFEQVSTQTKELQALATKIANDISAPAKDAVAKFGKDFKVS
jgi:phasin